MKGEFIKIIIVFCIICILCSGFSVGIKINDSKYENNTNASFYFVQITDTHVMHKDNDKYEEYKQNFQRVLQEINSFKEKPAFVALTGDTVEWGGKAESGRKNYDALISCLYTQDEHLYIDSKHSIPLYTTPGNHDYMFETKLDNYKEKINEENRYVVRTGTATFYFIDSGFNYILEPWDWARIMGSGLYDEDIQWLEEQLSNDIITGKKIILMHHPAVNQRDQFDVMIDCIARNREEFLDLCEEKNVDLVLTGHTHRSIIYDAEENVYDNLPISCEHNPTLFVQTNDCKQDVHYRNITVSCDDIVIHETVKINFEPKNRISIKTPTFLKRLFHSKTLFSLLG